MTSVHIDTKRRIIFYRAFQIEESIDGWEWCHEKYRPGDPDTGLCQTVFECVEAVDAWHDEAEKAA